VQIIDNILKWLIKTDEHNKYNALQDFHNPFILMNIISVGLLLLFLLVPTQASCPDPPLIIPNTFLDKIFDQTFSVLGNS
jgi:hypothetical protein